MIAWVSIAKLRNQKVSEPRATAPGAVVRWFGAMQAQDFGAAQWAVGLRIRGGSTAAAVERAFDQGKILRTHVMRPTWHFTSPQDIRWMLDLTGSRVRQAVLPYNRKLGVDAEVFSRATSVFERSLRDRAFLTRDELGARLRQNGLILNNAQLTQVAMNAELEGVICSGPRRGKQFTYALLAERAPSAVVLQRDEALFTLARRFLRSHGPATIRDFAWWSGMTVSDAKRGFEMNRPRQRDCDGLAYWTLGRDHRMSPGNEASSGSIVLLPVYDEYSVAYRDRDADPGIVVGAPSVVTETGTVGTWRAIRVAGGLHLSVTAPKGFTESHRRDLAQVVERYACFRALPCTYSVSRRHS